MIVLTTKEVYKMLEVLSVTLLMIIIFLFLKMTLFAGAVVICVVTSFIIGVAIFERWVYK